MALTDIQDVRIKIGDAGATETFTDAEVQHYLDKWEGNTYLAAAEMLDALAASAALQATQIRTLNYSASTMAIPSNLRALANQYRTQAYAEDPQTGVIEQAVSDFANADLYERYLENLGA